MSEYRTDEAFAIVPLWLIRAKVSDRALRLYALLSGMRDYGTDMATVGRKFLASELGCSTDTLDRAKAELETVEAITVERERDESGEIRRNVYTIHRVAASRKLADEVAAPMRLPGTDAARSPYRDESSSSSTGAVDDHTVRVQSSGGEGAYIVDVAAQDGKGTCSCKGFQVRKQCRHIREAREILGLPDAAGRLPGQVGGKRVTVAEHDRTDEILAAFNEVTGKRFAGAEWRRGIIGRIREHPSLTAAEHRAVIEHQVAHPWWKGDPSPAVIYGKGSVFDSALNGVRGGSNNVDDGFDAYN